MAEPSAATAAAPAGADRTVPVTTADVADAPASTAAIYRALLRAQVRAQASYRASFALDLASNVIFLGADLLTVLVLFHQVPALAGFTLAESLLVFGLAALGFALADLAVGNIERMKQHVRTGLLDAVLIRPLGVLSQLLVLDLGVRRVGRVITSTAVLAVAAYQAGVRPTPANLLLLVVTPLAGAVFFGSVFVATATVAFWWVESGELSAALTYGGRDFTSYPMTVYGGWFRHLMAFGLGFGLVAYYPALILLGRPDPIGAPAWLGWCGPLLALAAAALAALVWRTGVRHYRSTGS
ncbi:ABC transporter permease [Saccharothrix algeriensis]|uniref:Transporter n=1 Tax=Catellatospora bangladeshensis TaxID=310355 RepID=A0A8J3NEZ6_9ACTN|nr:ABC-2 family transporter protein [Catellatospora bangladeshensis]GIF78925.1 transporter [Catellatospora bangladeshensis]